MRAAGIAAATAMLIVLAACSDAEPDVDVIGQVRNYNDISMPLDAYLVTAEQEATLLQAVDLFTAECARRFGVTGLPRSETTWTRELIVGRRYGLINPADALQWGYNVPPRLDSGGTAKGDATSPDVWNPTDEEFVVIRGRDRYTAESREGVVVNGERVPDGGCAGEAERRLDEGAPSVNMRVADELRAESYALAETDSRVRAASDAWSACMKQSGYDYADIWAPNDREWPEPATSEEIATARTDVRCKQESNLAGIWLAVEVAYQVRLIDGRAEELDEVKKAIDVRLRNAAAALGRA
jgi:hypothetical protein